MSTQYCSKLQKAGYDVIWNTDYSTSIYILLGINYASIFPQRINHSNLNTKLRKGFPYICPYESYLTSKVILGGPLTAKNGRILGQSDIFTDLF